MLVPSTFTGWYRKTMVNARIPREVIRSRSHTANTGAARTGDLVCGSSLSICRGWNPTSGMRFNFIRSFRARGCNLAYSPSATSNLAAVVLPADGQDACLAYVGLQWTEPNRSRNPIYVEAWIGFVVFIRGYF